MNSKTIITEIMYGKPCRAVLGLVARIVRKNRQLGLTVLKQGSVHLQTKSFFFLHFAFISLSFRPSSLKESEICRCSAPCFKTVNSSCLLFLTVLARRLGRSPQSRTPCQQTIPCCTACLVWLVLGAREISL